MATSNKKVCVFCGSPPSNKNLEHVIPRWLIELTGNPKRPAFFGFTPIKGTERKFAYDQFRFPACSSCNSAYSKLEDSAKSCVLDLLNHNSVEVERISLLLDWLDKIRIGYWLGDLMLNKNPFGIHPKFHITSRIGKNDRLLFIYRSNFKGHRLNLSGTETPLFRFMPSCFTLIINDLFLFNASKDYIFAHRLGLPYLKYQYFSDGYPNSHGDTMVFTKGNGRVMLPLIRRPFLIKPEANVFQSIFIPEFIERLPKYFNTSYVRDNCIDWKKGKGKLFSEINGQLVEYTKNTPLAPESIYNDDYLFYAIAIQTFAYQTELLNKSPSPELLSKEVQERIKIQNKFCVNMNQRRIEVFEKRLADTCPPILSHPCTL